MLYLWLSTGYENVLREGDMRGTKDLRKYTLGLIGILAAVCMVLGLDVATVRADEAIAISTAEQLESIGQNASYPLDGDYILTCDIDMSGVKHTPIGTVDKPFTGTFNGAGYTISNLNIQGADIGAISGLSDKSLTAYGLFGVVKNSDNIDIARIQNVNIVSASISHTKTASGAAGIVAAVVYNGVYMDNIAIIDGTINLTATSGQVLYGAGHLAGIVWWDKDSAPGYKSEITDIHATGSISATGYSGENTVSGIVGCVYNHSVDVLSRIISLGALAYGDNAGYGIATSKMYDGNGIAEDATRAYYATEDGRGDNGIGNSISKGVLCAGNVALGDGWSQEKGVLPILKQAESAVSISHRIYISHKRNQSLQGMMEDFYVATTYNGASIAWTSSSENVTIDGATGLATVQTTDGYSEKVTLSYQCGSDIGSIPVTIGQSKDICFNTTYVKPGQTLKVMYAKDGSTYSWTKVNKSTNATTTIDSTTNEYTVTEDDLESFIYVTVNGSTKLSIYVSTIPVVYIDSTKGFSGLSKTTYYTGNIRLTGDSDIYAPWELYTGTIEFKGRGHSSSYYEKIGLKLKLTEKSDLYGVSGYENKHWVLISNVLDGTFMRNSIVGLLAQYMDANSVMEYTDVILIYNGDYKGVYQLYEHVRIDDGRVEVFDYEEYAKDAAKAIAKEMVKSGQLAAHYEDQYVDSLREVMENDYSYMDSGQIQYDGRIFVLADYGIEAVDQTGGYLVVMDRHSIDEGYKQATLHTAYHMPFYIDKPSTDTKSQLSSFKATTLYEYAVKYNQTFEYALHSDDFFFNNDDTHYKVVSEGTRENNKWSGAVYAETTYTDDENNGKHYSELFDIDSLVENFLICEFSQNYDSMKNSFYYKKDVGELAVVTPFWDYDWTLGNWITIRYTNMPTSWQTTLEGAAELYYQTVSWNRMLIRDPYFLMKVWEKYAEIRPTVIEDIVKEGGFVDTQYSKFQPLQAANTLKWGHLDVFMGFEEGMSTLRNFLNKRIPWFDKQFETLDTLVESLGYYHKSDYLQVESVTKNTDGSAHIEAKIDKDTVAYVAFQVNGTYLVKVPVENGVAVLDVPADKLSTDSYNMVEVKAIDAAGEYMVNSKYSVTGNYNLIHSNYCIFE